MMNLTVAALRRIILSWLLVMALKVDWTTGWSRTGRYIRNVANRIILLIILCPHLFLSFRKNLINFIWDVKYIHNVFKWIHVQIFIKYNKTLFNYYQLLAMCCMKPNNISEPILCFFIR